MATATGHRLYLCARCGKRATADRMVFSAFTRNHYCADVDACTRRAKRNATSTGAVRSVGVTSADGPREEQPR